MSLIEKQTQLIQSDPTSVPLPFKNRKVIATELGICAKTLSRWLHQEGIRLPKGLVSPDFQVLIYQKCLAKRGMSENVHSCPIMSTPSNLL